MSAVVGAELRIYVFKAPKYADKYSEMPRTNSKFLSVPLTQIEHYYMEISPSSLPPSIILNCRIFHANNYRSLNIIFLPFFSTLPMVYDSHLLSFVLTYRGGFMFFMESSTKRRKTFGFSSRNPAPMQDGGD